jgi:hypothetical protein
MICSISLLLDELTTLVLLSPQIPLRLLGIPSFLRVSFNFTRQHLQQDLCLFFQQSRSKSDVFSTAVISGDFGVHQDSAGRPFIDRDPKLFRHVLNYLRSQCTNLAVGAPSPLYALPHGHAPLTRSVHAFSPSLTFSPPPPPCLCLSPSLSLSLSLSFLIQLEHESKSKLAALSAEAEFYQVGPLMTEINMRIAALNRGEAAAAQREAEAAQREAAERRCRERSRGRDTSRGRLPTRRSDSNVASGEGGETLSQATTTDGYESASASDNEDPEHNTPLSQGRYEEAAHADLISQAASNMDSDF